jgi:hypothetical protein
MLVGNFYLLNLKFSIYSLQYTQTKKEAVDAND